MQLSNPSRLVYAPHTYGPSVYAQKYFGDKDFPKNMPAIWNARFAFLVETGSPVIIGEMGGFYTGKDREWQDWAFSFMKDKGIGVFYFAMNPGSKDTGGLLMDDWNTPEAAKLEMLSQLPSTDILEAKGRSVKPPQLPPPPPKPYPPSPSPGPPSPGLPPHTESPPPPSPTKPPPPYPPPGPSSPSPAPPDPSPPPPISLTAAKGISALDDSMAAYDEDAVISIPLDPSLLFLVAGVLAALLAICMCRNYYAGHGKSGRKHRSRRKKGKHTELPTEEVSIMDDVDDDVESAEQPKSAGKSARASNAAIPDQFMGFKTKKKVRKAKEALVNL